MDYPCVICKEAVEDEHEALQCDVCDRWQHRLCDSGVSYDSYQRLCEEEDFGLDWTCRNCTMPSIGNSMNQPQPIFESTRQSIPAQSDLSETIEQSVVDVQPTSSTVPEEPLAFRCIERGTTRGKPLLVDNIGYSYTIKTKVNSCTYWTCSVRSKKLHCKATVIEKDGHYTAGSHPHIHPAEVGLVTAVEIRKEVKGQARDDVFKSAPVIVENVIQENLVEREPCPALPKPLNLVRAANRARQRLRPADPTDLEFEIATDFLPENFLIGDIPTGSHRHLVFATPQQLGLLETAKIWYIDATFKIVKAPFVQLFSIHAFVRSGTDIKQLPLAFALMSRRRRKDYKKVLKCIKRNLSVVNLKEAVVDFEAGIWNALREVFPYVTMKGCSFHWSQAVFRRVQQLGLEPAYRRDDGTHKFIRMLLSLPFVPVSEIGPCFQRLREQVATPLEQLVSYIDETWFQSSVWSERNWGVFGRQIRTNNDVEGWHQRINGRAGRNNLQFYVLVPFLHREAQLVTIQARLVQEGKLSRTQRRSFRERRPQCRRPGTILEMGKSPPFTC